MTDLVGVLVGEYFLLECLAREGMVETYRARPTTRGGYDVLLRLFRPPFPDTTQFRDYFASEVEKVWHCHQASLLPLIEFATGDEWLYFLTVFPEMETLEQCLERRQRVWLECEGEHYLSLEIVTSIFIQLCEGLAYLHSHDIVHGNIQPSSIYVQVDEQERNEVCVFLTNLSMRHAYLEHEPLSSLLEEGNAAYIAPEQSIGMVSSACDVYALGMLLYHLLTGETPYYEHIPEEDGQVYKDAIMFSLRNGRPELPEAFIHVIQQALAKTPATRLSNVEAFARAWINATEKSVSKCENEAGQTQNESFSTNEVRHNTEDVETKRERGRSRVPVRARRMTWAWNRIGSRPE